MTIAVLAVQGAFIEHEKKLEKLGHSDSVQNAKDYLRDIAGIRVICYFIDDIYNLVNALKRQSELIFIREKDYIKNPKTNGYRSLHLVIAVPVYFLDGCEEVFVEVQLRTVAMDFWASLEHQLRYKQNKDISSRIDIELKACAEVSATLDRRMQKIFDDLNKMD